MACEQYQAMSIAPFHFRASIRPDQLLFILEVAIDLIWLENTTILQMVDTYTGLQDATVICGNAADEICLSFTESRGKFYTGYSNVIKLDVEAGFKPKPFCDLATMNRIKLQLSGSQSHSSIETEETYHEQL